MNHTPQEDRDSIDAHSARRNHEFDTAANAVEAAEGLCTQCGGPRSLAVHSAWASGVGAADHEFAPSPGMRLHDFTVTVTGPHGPDEGYAGYLESGYSADGVLTQLGESPEHRKAAAERYLAAQRGAQRERANYYPTVADYVACGDYVPQAHGDFIPLEHTGEPNPED
jgi:hypothetical protein